MKLFQWSVKQMKTPSMISMAHEKRLTKERQRLWPILIAVCAVSLLAILLVHGAKATPETVVDSCSSAGARSALGGYQSITIRVKGDQANADSCILGFSVTEANFQTYALEIPAGSPYKLQCTYGTGGTSPPGAPTTITFSAYADNANLGGGGIPIWTQTRSSVCASAEPYTDLIDKYATSDGTITGTPKGGLIRLFVAITLGGTSGYSCNSDDTGTTPPTGGNCGATASSVPAQGLIRSNPGFSVANLTSAAGSFTTYVGGDTLQTKITSNAAEYNTATRMKSQIKTGVSGYFQVGSNFNPAVGVNTQSQAVTGAPSSWTPGAIINQWTVTGFSQLTGFEAINYWRFTTATAPNPLVIVDSNTIQWATGDTLSRTLTPSASCTVALGALPTTIFNRADASTVSACGWQNARGNAVTTSQLGRSWLQKTGDYRATADYPLADSTFTSGGNLAGTQTSTTASTVTTGLGYHKMVESFGTTRTDTDLQNWGNTSGLFDVTNTWTFTNLLNSKTTTGANSSFFTLGVDNEFLSAKGLSNANNQKLSGIAVSCIRVKPDTTTESTNAMGNTNANGDSPEISLVAIPPVGVWSTTCAASGSGNTASYRITYFHTSPFTADKAVGIIWNITKNGSLYDVNVTSIHRMYDTTSDDLIQIFPDQNTLSLIHI